MISQQNQKRGRDATAADQGRGVADRVTTVSDALEPLRGSLQAFHRIGLRPSLPLRGVGPVGPYQAGSTRRQVDLPGAAKRLCLNKHRPAKCFAIAKR